MRMGHDRSSPAIEGQGHSSICCVIVRTVGWT